MLPRLHIEIERWKFNSEYGVYISTLGNLRDERKRKIEPVINQRTGYFQTVTIKGFKTVHRIVAETFLGKSELTVDHIDSNRRNNKLSNLRFCTAEENIEFANEKLYVEKTSSSNKVRQKSCYEGRKVFGKDIESGVVTRFRNIKSAAAYLHSCRNVDNKTKDIRIEIKDYLDNNKDTELHGFMWSYE